MESFRTRKISGLTGGDSTEFVDQEETSGLGSPLTDPMSIEWTDEKHSLYLKSMEASFVDQLYNSFGLLGWQPQKENPSDSKPSRPSASQFKVLRSGSWKRIDFERARKQMVKADGSHILLANPWIQHFRPVGRDEALVLPTLQENGASTSKANSSRGKKALPCGLPITSKQFPIYQFQFRQADSLDANAVYNVLTVDSSTTKENQSRIIKIFEVSDQNFLDEDVKGGKESSPSLSAKRMKTLVVDNSINDQVVPSDRYPSTGDVTENNVPAG